MNAAFRRTGCSRADLVRLMATVPRAERANAAATLGFVREREPDPEIEWLEMGQEPIAATEEQPISVPQPISQPADVPQIRMWRLETMTFQDEPDRPEAAREQVQGLTHDDLHGTRRSLFAIPKTPSLAPWSRLWPRLRHALHSWVSSREPDVTKWIRRVSRGEVMVQIPRRERRAWPSRISIWVDRSRRLLPFWSDQIEVCRQLHKVCDRQGLVVRWLDAHTQHSSVERRGDFLEKVRPDAQTPVLVLGDLGLFGSEDDRAAWRKTGLRLRRWDVRLSALVPATASRWTPALAELWKALSWEQGSSRSGMGLARNANLWQERAERLLKLMSPAAYVQPGLLRALRLLLPPGQADASTEADVWNHSDVRAADAAGCVLWPEAAAKWRDAFVKEEDSALKERVSGTIRNWHRRLPHELLRAETLLWLSVAPDVEAPGDVRDALDFASRLEGSALASGDDPECAEAVRRYGHALLAGMPEAIYERIPALRTLWVASFEGVPAPPGIGDPNAIRAKIGKAGETRHWAIRQVGLDLEFSLNTRGTEWPSYVEGPGSPVAWLVAARPWVTIVQGSKAIPMRLEEGLSLQFDPDVPVELRTDRCTIKLTPWWFQDEPGWIAAGRDRFGLWADAKIHGVVQRFRWIPPGKFLMGSPENEEGRFDFEGPQHWVELTEGRWLGDTPVTQGLWKAVTGKNPSYFRGDKQSTEDRPVEQVSLEDCVEFVEKIAMRLPTEAEWESACRAGTSTATWVGDRKILGTNNAPTLDPIAWYGGNCGVEYDLDFGFDTTNWPDKQHEFARGGTRAVGKKEPNPFGLHDMLGNVYEWCRDAYARDTSGAAANAVGVFRGGSWRSVGRLVRAAGRLTRRWDYRIGDLGFRLARGPAITDPEKKGGT